MAGAISADLIKELIRLEHIEPGVALTSYYRSGNRPDGRAGGYNAFREVRLTQLSSDRCQVEIGNTIVSAAISVAFGTPSPAASDQGKKTSNAIFANFIYTACLILVIAI